jgi:hypothetical protein
MGVEFFQVSLWTPRPLLLQAVGARCKSVRGGQPSITRAATARCTDCTAKHPGRRKTSSGTKQRSQPTLQQTKQPSDATRTTTQKRAARSARPAIGAGGDAITQPPLPPQPRTWMTFARSTQTW